MTQLVSERSLSLLFSSLSQFMIKIRDSIVSILVLSMQPSFSPFVGSDIPDVSPLAVLSEI